MRLPHRSLFLVLAVLLVLATAAAEAEAAPKRPTVILISLDGVSGKLVRLSHTPSLDALAKAGARVERLIPPFPSSTFPAHATIATGVHPSKHGIINNKFFDMKRGNFDRERPASWLRAEPLWVTAERQGVRAGVIMWVTSEGDWRGSLPSYHVKFRRRTADDRKVERIRHPRLGKRQHPLPFRAAVLDHTEKRRRATLAQELTHRVPMSKRHLL